MNEANLKRIVKLLMRGKNINYKIDGDRNMTFRLDGFGQISMHDMLWLKSHKLVRCESGNGFASGWLTFNQERQQIGKKILECEIALEVC